MHRVVIRSVEGKSYITTWAVSLRISAAVHISSGGLVSFGPPNGHVSDYSIGRLMSFKNVYIPSIVLRARSHPIAHPWKS